MSEPANKRARTQPSYTLLYHPGIPGRGEYIRLAFEASGTPYSDPANETEKGASQVYSHCTPDSLGEDGNPPPFAPPMLKISGAGKDGNTLLLNQTPNILFFLGERLDLAGEDPEVEKWHVNELALTALDLSNETHDTHHPVALMKYYEDQKEEALKKAMDFRENRIPKFFGYFERVLKGNERGGGKYLVGGRLTYADTTLWQVLDGLYFAFPKELEAREKDYSLLFTKFYLGVKEEKGLKEYLSSDRRLKFSNGLFRRYPELDRQ